ncbi:MAG: hypothetical protein IPM02_08695 [Betaproteobacteria bacterium]|nr:hypothetical protein [Betaproteobacteria bacterium]
MINRLFGIQIARRDDPLANEKSVRLWVSGLPPNDPVGAIEAISRLLESARAAPPAATHDYLRALMELDRAAVPLQAQLQAQSRMATMSDDVRQRLWRACDDVARGFAHRYEQVGEAVQVEGDHTKVRAELHGVYARMFYYTGVQYCQALFRYEQWIPGKWRQLHAAYREACQQGVVAEAFALEATAVPAERLSPEQEYLQILLLQRMNTGNLTAQQIDWAAAWLRGWAHLLRLAMGQLEGDGFWLDLGRGEGLVHRRPASPAGDVLYLDVMPLHAHLAILVPRLEVQAAANPAQPELSEQLALARRLVQLWRPQAGEEPRRGARRPAYQDVHVAAGWAEITVALSAKKIQKSGAPEGYHYDDYGRLRQNKDGQRVTGDTRRMDPDAWQVRDASDSDLRIWSASRRAARQRPGVLLALQLEDDPRWQLGIVRRLKRLGAGQIELGVEIIAANAALVLARELDVRDTGYSVDGVDIGQKGKSFSALYLPSPQAHTRVAPAVSLVLQPAEYAKGRLLSLLVDGHYQDACLSAAQERTKDWVWTRLEDIR